jgi:outer membrane protein assembly factor BamB
MAWHSARIAFFVSAFSIGAEAALAAPALTMTPNSGGHPGVIRQISGTGFTANEAVDVYFDTADQFLAVTDGSGKFADHELDTPKSALPGTHWITAIGRKTGDAVQKSFLVATYWLQFGFDSHNRRRNPYENVINTSNAGSLDIAWSRATNGQVESSPAVYNSLVYAGSDDGKLYALNASSGAIQWTATTGDKIWSSPAVARGNVYVGSLDKKVYAFKAMTGTPVWSVATSGAVMSSPAVVGNTLFVGSQDGSVRALNATTGLAIWSTALGADIDQSSPAVVNGVVYIGCDDDKVYALNEGTGQILWTSPAAGAPFYGSPAVANGVVYATSFDNSIYAFSASTGDLVWSYATTYYIDSSPAVINGTVYAASADGYLYALSASSGSVKWKTVVPGGTYLSSVAIANGVGYVGSYGDFGGSDGNLTGVDLKTGEVLWSASGLGTISSSPAISDGVLYVGSFDHHIYAFALDGGSNAAYHQSPTPPSYASLHPDFRLKPVK